MDEENSLGLIGYYAQLSCQLPCLNALPRFISHFLSYDAGEKCCEESREDLVSAAELQAVSGLWKIAMHNRLKDP
jgi:hypothetical protein